MPALATEGLVYYNGYTFGPLTETLSIDSSPVEDQAKRTIAYWVHRLTLKTYIKESTVAAGGTTGPQLDTIRERLLMQGGKLIYTGKGFDISVNSGGGPKDVIWGPKPAMLRWKPYGKGACEITWAVEVAIPEGCASPAYEGKPMEVNYRLTFALDKSRYTTRTCTGYLKIPMTRQANTRFIPDNVDTYREKIVPAVPFGFQRIRDEFNIDESKTKLDWSIVDEQLPPNAPPPGIVEVSSSHTIQSQGSTLQWAGTISGSYEVARDKPRELAYQYFMNLFAKRFATVQLKARMPNTNGPGTIPAGGTVLIKSVMLSEPEINGRKTANCSIQYTFTTTLKTILEASGLWTPVPNSDSNLFRASMANIWHPRGHARLASLANEDVIVDLCSGTQVVLKPKGLERRELRPVVIDFPKPKLDPKSSWLAARLWVEVKVLDNVVELKPLPLKPIRPKPPTAPISLGGGALGNAPLAKLDNNQEGYAILYNNDISAKSIVQQRAAPQIKLTLNGYALRAGYPISPPTVDKVGDVDLIPDNGPENYFRQGIVTNWNDVPIVRADWSLSYIVPQVPADPVGVPPNPVLAGG